MPAPTRIHLVRHGRVVPDWEDRFYGDLDVPLSAEGEQELHLAAERLSGVQLAAVVSSGLARAEFGAALLRAGRGLERRDEPALREIDRGRWRGLSRAELEAREPGALAAWRAAADQRPPEGESLDDLAARVLPCITRLAAEHAGREIAIVTHSWVGRLVAAAALGLPPLAVHRFELQTGASVVVDWPLVRSGLQPTLVAFAADRAPGRHARWFRGPHRG